jgi:RNA polymerase sigma-70 factor (ECF subfamily)
MSVSPGGPTGDVTGTMMTEMTEMTDLGELYRQHADELVRYATVLVGPDDASEVVSDAVLGARHTRWSTVENPRAYLFRCVHNRAMSQKRAEVRRLTRERTTARPDLAASTDPSIDALRALDRLSTQQRAVVYLTYWEDMTPAAIADSLGIGEGSVRKQLARAREQLRTVLS